MYSNRGLSAFTTALILALTCSAHAVDSDGDGVNDNFDNCIDYANTDQRDSNSDGFGNRCDADFNGDNIVNATDLGYLRSVFFTNDPDGDLDGNGVVNASDLGILRQLFFQPPGPAGEDANPSAIDPVPPPQLDVTLRIVDGCPFADGSFGHDVTVSWETAALGSLAQVDIQAQPADGLPVLAIGSGNPGTASFTVNDPYGGPLQVVVQAQYAGTVVVGGANTILGACLDRPVIPPGLGFQDQPIDEPPVIGLPDGTPDEIDVVTLGGSNNGPVEPRAVVATGTGAGFKLYAFDIDFNGTVPLPLVEAGPVAGLDVKLHALVPENHSFGDIYPFVSGYRRDGSLWLRTWQLVNDNALMDFTYRGYGENAQVTVEAYDIAHRILPDGDYQIVTPVRTARNNLRLITWEVDRQTGVVSGRQDSGDWGTPRSDTELSIAHLTGNRYVVNYRNIEGNMTSRYWLVRNDGTPVDQGGMSSSFNIRGTGIVQENMSAAKVLPLGEDDFVTPIVKHYANTVFEVATWETRLGPYNDGIFYNTFKISDNTRDEDPFDLGVSILPLPTLTDATDNQGVFLQNVRALLTDSRWEEIGVGQGELFSQIPQGELTSVHIASVSKVMTLLLAVEAVDRGDVSLDDMVEISPLAANLAAPGSSNMGLEADDEQSLNTLLHGMMLVSANDGSAAIAEHIAGDWESFAGLMQARADSLGLDDTTYGLTSNGGGTPAGGGISTPQDQVTLWRFASQYDLFREIAQTRNYFGCGVDAQGDEKCHLLDKFSDSNYPGLGGWKGGNGGFIVQPYFSNGGPFCVGSGCLIAETTRLGRTMQVALQQSGNRWGDHDDLLNYGYRLQFTPDRRDVNYIVGQVVDFGIDHIGDQVALVAYLNEFNRPQLCSYSTFADLGQISSLGCGDIDFTGVAGSADQAAPSQVDGALISTFLVEGDYLTGYITGMSNQLNLNLWRVGPTEP